MFKTLLRRPRSLIASLALGAAQGLALYLLVEQVPTTAASQYWKMPLTALAALLPLSYLMLKAQAPLQRIAFFLIVQTAVLAGIAFYGVYVFPQSQEGEGEFGFLLCLLAAWFASLLLMLARERARAAPGSFYARLYAAVLGAFSTFSLAGILFGAFWLLLMLWAALFQVVGIHLFHRLFSHELFAYGISGAVFATALILAQARMMETDVLLRYIVSPAHYLLPLASFIALLFALCLPFTGLQPLWDTGYATTLMLALQAAVILLVVSAYQDGGEFPSLPRPVLRLVSASLVILPVYALLSAYALHLRVEQHGWSADRVWAALIIAFFSAASFGYAWAALCPGPWLRGIERINVLLVWTVLLLSVLAATPPLNPQRIAAVSQTKRLLAGHIKADKFDYAYLRFSLGTHGTRALEALSTVESHPDAALIREKAREMRERQNRYDTAHVNTTENLRSHVFPFPESEAIDADFSRYLLAETQNRHSYAKHCFIPENSCVLLKTDLNGDGAAEYALLGYSSTVYMRRGDAWVHVGTLQNVGMAGGDWLKYLRTHGFTVADPAWDNVLIGKHRLSVWEIEERRHGSD